MCRVSAGLAVVGIVAGIGVGGPGAAGGATQNPYSATSDAAALRVSIHDPQIVPFLEGGGFDATSPSAQATADTRGDGRSLASMVYPGQDIAGLSKMIGQFAPPGTPMPDLPDWPVTVVADSGTPHPAGESTPGYQLSADVGDGTAAAEANGGLPKAFSVGGLNATASAQPTDSGGVRSDAKSTFSLLSFGNLLSLGTVTSEAIAERSSDGKLTRESHLSITGAKLLGLPLEIRDGKLAVPLVGNVPVPVMDLIAKLPLLDPLRKLGVTLTIEQAQETPNGIIAPAIQLTYQTKTPAIPLPAIDIPTIIPGQPAIGPLPPSTYTTVITLGYAHAQADLTPLPPFEASPPPPVNIPPQSTKTSNPGSGVGTTVPVVGSSSPNGGPVIAPGQTSTGPQTTTPTQQQPQNTTPQTYVGYRVRAKVDALDVYLAIVVVGLIALGTGQLTRLQGVRTRWKS